MIRESDNWLEIVNSLVENAPDQITIVDRAHRIQFVNRLMSDRRLEDTLGVVIEDFAVGEVKARVARAIDHVFATGACTSYDATYLFNGHKRWCSTRLGPVLVGGVVKFVTLMTTDLTERRLAADRLRQSEERLRTLVEHAPEAITILDVDSGRFTMVNTNACALFRLSEAELLKKGPAELSREVQPGGRRADDMARAVIQAALDGEVPAFEWVHLRSDGQEVPCEVRLVRLPDPVRRLVRGSLTDITERKRAERERERMAERGRTSQKMEALGQLTGGVAHDFNNLLTVIQGNLELLSEALPEHEHLRSLIDTANAATEHAGSLTQRLLAFSRKHPLRPVLVDLSQLLADMHGLLVRSLGEMVDVHVTTPEDLWHCELDPTLMESALLNLALNARDAMPRGGRLSIETRNIVVSLDEASEELPANEYVELSVTDEGEGMEPGVCERALEPFFTTKELGRGSGMGLAMVYGFVRQSGGWLGIESRVGEGTRVRMRLPRASDRAAPSVGASEELPHGRGERVLVVEDEEQLRHLARTFLEALGYRTLVAADGPEALALLEAGESVDLLFTDVVLSQAMSGFDLARLARMLLPELPVLYTSGYAPDSFLDEETEREMVLLPKPFRRATLAQYLRKVLESR